MGAWGFVLRRHGGQSVASDVDVDLRLAVGELETGRARLREALELPDRRKRRDEIACVLGKLALARRALDQVIERLEPKAAAHVRSAPPDRGAASEGND